MVPLYEDRRVPAPNVGAYVVTDAPTTDGSLLFSIPIFLITLLIQLLDLLVTYIINLALDVLCWLLELAKLSNRQRWLRFRRLGRRRTTSFERVATHSRRVVERLRQRSPGPD
jgi:hypothetical protein